jgi:hypothetical protein
MGAPEDPALSLTLKRPELGASEDGLLTLSSNPELGAPGVLFFLLLPKFPENLGTPGPFSLSLELLEWGGLEVAPF